jgi:hypothetical protein
MTPRAPRPPLARLAHCATVQLSLLRRSRRAAAAAAGALLVLLLLGLGWLALEDCSVELANDVFAPATPLPAFPAHARVRAAGDATAPVDVVYVTAFPRNALSSLRSLCFFAAAGALGTVHLVVPDRMADFFSSASALDAMQCPPASAWQSRAPALVFQVWPESHLVRRFGAGGGAFGGTTRQMTLKLAAAAVVTTPFYLVMDSDVYARRAFSRADLFDASGMRARANMDQNDFCQPPTWFNQAARVLQTRLVADTDAFCARAAAAAGFGAPVTAACPLQGTAAPSWFAATGNETVPDDPFALRADAGGRAVYGACRSSRGHAPHVTPMILARSVVLDVLRPRLEALADLVKGPGGAPRDWLDVLLDFHAKRAAGCRQGLVSGGRLYSWTEYTLYFLAAAASGAMGQYHAFAEGGITSITHSMMKPWQYDAADWAAIFASGRGASADARPFFIVHSWFAKSIEATDARMAPFVPTLAAGAARAFPPPPTPAPFW